MTTSGTSTFDPTVADIIDEAFERIGKDPATLTARHLISARMSMNYLVAGWAALGIKLWAIEQGTQTTTINDPDYTLSASTVDIIDVMLRRDGVDNEMQRISRSDYAALADKTNPGRPNQYYLDRQRAAPVLYIWPAPENSTDVIVYNRLRKIHDAGNATNTMDIAYHWFEAFTSGLAAKLSEKYNKAIEADMVAKAAQALKLAREEDRERASTVINVCYS